MFNFKIMKDKTIKGILVLIGIMFIFTHVSIGQNTVPTQSIKEVDYTKQRIFLLKATNGNDYLAEYILIRSFEIASVDVLERKDFLKTHDNVPASMIIQITPKASVEIIDLKQIMNKYHIAEAQRNLHIVVDGLKVRGKSAIYASADAIQSVTVDDKNKQIVIISKPETVEQRKQLKY
jgi:hypothetical protein